MKKETVRPVFSQTEKEKGSPKPERSGKAIEPIGPELLHRLQAGDHAAFRSIYLQCVDSVRNFLTLLLHSRDEAEELTQEIFVRLWERHDQVDPAGNFRSYLFTLTKWAAYNLLDHKKVEKKYQEFAAGLPPDFPPSPDDLISTEELALLIRIHVERMPAKQRKVFEMSRFEGKTHAEIARLLHISEATVRVHIHAATLTLKHLFTLFVCWMLSP